MTALCSIIGVLDNGAASLSAEALQLVRSAQHVIAGSRLLKNLSDECNTAQQYDLTGCLSQVPLWINAALLKNESVVVLASGDPLCHGIAGFLAKKLKPEQIQIIPNVSSIQLAFAALKMAWQSASIASVHTQDTGEWVHGATSAHGMYVLVQQCRQQSLLAILTSPENNPPRIARMLQMEGLDEVFEMAIAQYLQQPEQVVTDFLPVAEVANHDYGDPNVVILKRKTSLAAPVLFGLRDDSFQQRKPEKGLITKCEVRAVSLARLQLTRISIVWDIGAGSGSVGLEAARLCTDGHVFAIEKNSDDLLNIAHNHAAFGVSNYTAVLGKAPQYLAHWLDPDAVFIGGSGGELAELITLCLQRLKPQGWLVMNFVTLENMSTAVDTLKQRGATWDVCQIQASRSSPILTMHRLQAENPVWIIAATLT
ncbi:MAG: precorrin-6y C5,15-methyltransferase (decarboxylating) subunit CbiE [Methylococcaceae bacterium]|nr:precorrin-6y C5,15-methyltransferase (decarboxylating) subunit CbiE [Methylococcaceae bacterium]